MALKTYCSRSCLYKTLNSFYILYSYEHIRKKSILITTDALDDFTTQLLQKKTTKWDMVKERAKKVQIKDCTLNSRYPSKFNIKQMNATELDTVFETAIDDNNKKNLIVLIQQCMEHKMTPSLIILMNLLSYFSTNGDCEMLNKIIELYEVMNPKLLETNSNFVHYIAEGKSVNGDTNTAIGLFEKVYVENTFLRRRISLMLNRTIMEVVNNKSEAAIVVLLKFTENLYENHKDISPLAFMWETCFLSEWFAEQMLAIDILKRHKNLLAFITGRINSVINLSLRKQQCDPVLRLLEYLLKNNFQTQYSIVIVTMFDYSYKRKNLKACVDIVNWWKKYEISLSNSLDDKYLELVLRQMKNDSMKMIIEKPVNEFKF